MTRIAPWLVFALACTAPAPAPSSQTPVVTAPKGSAMQPTTPAPLGLRPTLRALLDLASARWPVTAEHVIDHLQPHAIAITTSNQNLEHPAWASSVSDPKDTYVELRGEIAGAALPVDRGGHGQYVYLYVPGGKLADVETVTGPLNKAPRVHWDSPQVSIAYPEVAGHRLRVLVEEARDGRQIIVKVHYER